MKMEVHSHLTKHFNFLLLISQLIVSTCILAQDSDVVVYDSKTRSSKALSDFTVQYLEESQGISILNFTGNYDKTINGITNFEARQAVLREFYQNQPDIYDFVYIFTEFEFSTGNSDAFATSFMNDIEGIGKPIFDSSLDYFSENLQLVLQTISPV